MDSLRLSKVSRLLQRELGDIFQKTARNDYKNAIITVTDVNVSKDLSVARVYLSIFTSDDKEALFERIIANTKETRYQLSQKIKNQVRIIPDLKFFIDDSLDYIEHIDTLLKK